ncbi:MAG: sigma-E processing peptidase SpoIIGA [Acetatifactor sp.]|nr:sigma-E processing peptidase SpoIIGA [Acetatifactor sp.]
MHYELYVDSLFLVNFVMNLYLLMLVNRSAFRTATPGRLLLGAAVGGLGGLLPYLLPGPGLLKMGTGIVAGTVGMILMAFPVRGFRMFVKLLEKLLLYSFCMGGALLFLVRAIPGLRNVLTSIFGIMGVGGLCFLFLSRSRKGGGQEESLCRAVLICKAVQLEVIGLVDSGNTLTEPISGKPVCIVTEQILSSLKGDLPDGYRAVPYHSIGKKRGILEGYQLPELKLELNGITRTFRQVWIAASPQGISEQDNVEAESVKMIVNPLLFLEQKKGGPRRRQNERIYDTESSITR